MDPSSVTDGHHHDPQAGSAIENAKTSSAIENAKPILP